MKEHQTNPVHEFSPEHKDQYKQMLSDFQQVATKHPMDAILQAEGDPTFERALALQQEGKAETATKWQKGWHLLKSSYLCDSRSLHGDAYVDPNVYADDQRNAYLISFTTGLNSITLWLFFLFMLSGLPYGSGIPIASLFTTLLAAAQNKCSEGAARHTPGKKAQSTWLLGTVIALQAGATAAGVLGVTASLRQDTLAARQAETITQTQVIAPLKTQVETAESLSSTHARINRECDELTKILESLPPGDPRRTHAFLQAYGPFDELNKDRSNLPDEELETCHLKKRLDQRQLAAVTQAKTDLSTAGNQLRERGARGFLKVSYPDLYHATFTPDGHLRDGVQLMGLSVSSMVEDILTLKLGNLVIPGFILLLSAATSALAVGIVYTHRFRRDVWLSHDPNLRQARERFFYEMEHRIQRWQHPEARPKTVDITAKGASRYGFSESQQYVLTQTKALKQAIADEGGYWNYAPWTAFVERYDQLLLEAGAERGQIVETIPIPPDDDIRSHFSL